MRTVLAPLKLMGLGTPAVESLASYFLRLAAAHQVSPAQLSRVLCNDSDYLHVADGPTLRGCYLYQAMLCSYSEQTRVLVRRLEKLTGARYLACGTLLPLAGALCQNQTGAIVRSRRWCPSCYAGATNGFAEPLAWSLPLITRCPEHNVPLNEHCPHCGSRQGVWRLGDQRRSCGKCGRSLSQAGVDSAERVPWDAWCQGEALKILRHLATPDAPAVCHSAFETFLHALPESMFDARHRLGYILQGFHNDRRRRPDARARMNTIFRVAALWGTTPMDIFLRPTEAASPALFEAAAPVPDPPAILRYPKDRIDHCKKKFEALLLLSSDVLLPSAEGVCKKCIVNDATFRRHHLELWSRYMNERRMRQARQLDVQVSRADRYMHALLARLRENGQRLHRKNAVAAMMADIHVPKAVARSAIRVAVAGMRVERGNRNVACKLA